MTPVAVVAALASGLILGLLGGGGSILTVPVLVYALGVDPKLAVVMSLPIVGGAALVGAVQHWRLGHVELRTAVPFGLVAMAGAYGGAVLARALTGSVQMLILASVMLIAATLMIRNTRTATTDTTEARPSRPRLFGAGALAGALTGIVGVGGGFLMVPALVLLGGLQMSHAVGTSLLVIAMNTAAGYAGHHGSVVVPWTIVLSFAGLTAVGILVGGVLSKRVPTESLKRAFSFLLIGIAAMLLWQNLVVH